MARIRTVKPEFWTDEKVVELGPWARLLFLGMLNFSDDAGRMVHSPRRIKMQILPADSVSIPELLKELDAMGFVQFYAVKGVEYLQIVNFNKHQKINHPSKTLLPGPELQEGSGSTAVRNGMEGNGMEGNKTVEEELRSSSPVLDLRLPLGDQEEELPSSKKLKSKTTGALAFDAYADAYHVRYAVAPVANEKTRGQFAQLVKRLGNDAVAVAGFYPTHTLALYVRSGHAVDLLLRDCEKLRMEWATGKRITDTGAKQQDRASTTAAAAAELIAEGKKDAARR